MCLLPVIFVSHSTALLRDKDLARDPSKRTKDTEFRKSFRNVFRLSREIDPTGCVSLYLSLKKFSIRNWLI